MIRERKEREKNNTPEAKAAAAIAAFKQGMQADAQKLLEEAEAKKKAAEEEAKRKAEEAAEAERKRLEEEKAALQKPLLRALKEAVRGVRDEAAKGEEADDVEMKVLKDQVGMAMSACIASGLPQRLILEASQNPEETEEENEAEKGEAAEGEGEEKVKKPTRTERVKKSKEEIAAEQKEKEELKAQRKANKVALKKAVNAAFDAKEQGLGNPQVIKAATTAAKAAGGDAFAIKTAATRGLKIAQGQVTREPPKEGKEGDEGSSSSSSDSSEASTSSDSEDYERERPITDKDSMDAKMDGMKAAFYFNVQ